MRSLARLPLARILGLVGIGLLTVATIGLSAFAVQSARSAPKESGTWPVLQAVNNQPVAVFLGGSESLDSAGHASWPTLVAQARGWQQVNLAHGGTGYTVSGTCGSAPCPEFLDSVPQIVALNPQIVVVAGGWAETGDKTDVSVRVAQTFQGLHQGLPHATIIAVGPGSAGPPPEQVLNVDAAVKTAASSLGLTYVSLLDPPALDPSMFAADGSLTDVGQAAIAARVGAAVK